MLNMLFSHHHTWLLLYPWPGLKSVGKPPNTHTPPPPLRIPGFLAPGIGFVEGKFSMDWGGAMVRGQFKHIKFIMHFISNLMLWLIWQEVPVHSPEVGEPLAKSYWLTDAHS